MITHERSIKVFTGNANRALAEDICKAIGIRIGDNEVKSFADGEVSCSINESVRGSDVFLIQSTCKPVNQNLMELLIMIDACRRASAGRITAIIPYFGYARQDRKTKSRDPISAKLVANMITTAGADRIITMDLHASQIQGFFDIPADNLLSYPVFTDYYAKKFGDSLHDMVVVSPDVGPIARARKFAQSLEANLAIVDRRIPDGEEEEQLRIIGDVDGRDCILFADIVDTAYTVVSAAKALAEIGGARRIYACATHGVLSDLAIERLAGSNIDELALLDTIPAHPDAQRAHLKYLTVAPLFGEAIERVYKDISITKFVF
ncbi:MAG: ribose-phosphate pyrophosphokinase [Oscillospiraceae bacterium]|nr:ribose-phosphate pyrophosphokinase [Oscillospiraceae bacterium]